MTIDSSQELTLALEFDTDEGLPLSFLTLTSHDLGKLMGRIAAAKFGPGLEGHWTVDTDELRVVAHVNGLRTQDLESVILDAFDGIKAIEFPQTEWPTSFDQDSRSLARAIVRRVKRNVPATLTAKDRTPLEIDATPSSGRPLLRTRYSGWGTIDGKLDVISVRSRPFFVVHEHGTNVPVKCTLADEWMPDVKKYLGQRVIIEGLVRYSQDGRPTNLVNPTAINLVPDPEYPLDALRGALPGITKGLSAYEFIRRLREAETA